MTVEEFEDLSYGDLVEIIDHPRFNNESLRQHIGNVYAFSHSTTTPRDNLPKAKLFDPDTDEAVEGIWSSNALRLCGNQFDTDMSILFGGVNL